MVWWWCDDGVLCNSGDYVFFFSIVMVAMVVVSKEGLGDFLVGQWLWLWLWSQIMFVDHKLQSTVGDDKSPFTLLDHRSFP